MATKKMKIATWGKGLDFQFVGWISKYTTLRITGPCYRGVWMCIAGVRDLQTTSFEIPWFLGDIKLKLFGATNSDFLNESLQWQSGKPIKNGHVKPWQGLRLPLDRSQWGQVAIERKWTNHNQIFNQQLYFFCSKQTYQSLLPAFLWSLIFLTKFRISYLPMWCLNCLQYV